MRLLREREEVMHRIRSVKSELDVISWLPLTALTARLIGRVQMNAVPLKSRENRTWVEKTIRRQSHRKLRR